MESEKFDLVFSGQIMPKQDLAVVKSNMANLFKISNAQVDVLFSGKKVVLKRNVDLTAANRYRVAIKKAGARVELVKSHATAPQPIKPASKTDDPMMERPPASTGQGVAVSKANPISASTVTQKVSAKNTINEAVVEQASTHKPSTTSTLKVLPVGEGLLVEKNSQHHADVDVPEFEVLDAGSDLLSESERPSLTFK